ncbi:unknown protein [Leptolyngbya sp. NIES-3755]|nr:unknown protein [Leptolyngbya sp. NIES-3755]
MRINPLFVLIQALFPIFAPQVTIAQVVPDSTSNSKVTSSDNTQLLITGGSAESRNLFHSFDRFSLGSGQTAIFAPDSTIANIITRVTGTEASRIDGTIAVRGNANLFLVNPNGIVFGQNASLAIAGSFFATTDPGWRFSDGVSQSKPPLLTISAPIVNTGNLNVGGDLSIVAGTVSGSGQFTAGNRVGITTNTLTLDQAKISARNGVRLDVQDATLSNSRIDSTVGDIDIHARSFALLNGATINTSIPANSQGQSGNVNLNIQDNLTIFGRSSGITSAIDGQGIGGDITVYSDSLHMLGGSRISTTLNGTGQAGSINIQTRDGIQLEGANGLKTEISSDVTRQGVGTAGDIRVAARTISLTNQAKITALTLGQAASGNVEITALDRITVEGTGEIFDWLRLISRLFSDPSIRIENNLFKNQNRTLFPVQAVIDASNAQTGVLVSSFTPLKAGNLSITAPDIQFSNQALLAVNSWGSGNGGNLRLVAEQFTVKDSSLFTSTISGKGANIEIDTPRLRLDQGAIVSGVAQGQGGNIALNVPDLLILRNRSRIAARGFNNVDSGNININAGLIVANPIENSVIIANAVIGKGGNIQVNARSLIGIKYDQTLVSSSSQSSINASSQFGLSGEVKLNVLRSDPGSEAVKLPTEMTDSSTQIDQTCSARSRINSFTRTGRGGIAPDLAESNRSTPVWVDSRSPQSSAVVEKETQIVEATGWIRNSVGQIELVQEGSNAQLISPVVCEHKQ